MANWEKVIKGLECKLNPSYDTCKDCQYYGEEFAEDYPDFQYYCNRSQIEADALGLLKAQEARVMMLKEIVSAECVWIEYATSGNIVIALPWNIELTDDTYNFIGMPNCFVEFRSLYSKEWRCWTSRPSDSERENTPWE